MAVADTDEAAFEIGTGTTTDFPMGDALGALAKICQALQSHRTVAAHLETFALHHITFSLDTAQ